MRCRRPGWNLSLRSSEIRAATSKRCATGADMAAGADSPANQTFTEKKNGRAN
jgi:hypothetical protein